jgi:carbon storage regulator
MLVLSRRVGETIAIDNNVYVTVLEVVGNRVRLGIEAPKSVHIDRMEVRNRQKEFFAELSQPAVA